MRNSPPSVIFGIIILFLGFIVLPIYYTGIIQWRDDMNIVQTETRNFLDKICDNHYISENALADYNLHLASCSSVYSYEIIREEMITNPRPDENSIADTSTTWIYTNNLEEFHRGDFVTIEVTPVSDNMFQRISAQFLAFVYGSRDFTLTEMVR